jgi:membrane protease YdiL (CAAX protease family)
VKQQLFMVPKPFNWKIFSTLFVASILGVLAVLPYSLALQAKVLESAPPPLPLAILIPIQILQNAILFALVIAAGLWAANRTGLSFPILEDGLAGRPIKDRLKGILLPSISVGVIASMLIILLEIMFFEPMLAAQLGDRAAALYLDGAAAPSAWKGFLASFYGGINEEILLRLGLMSILAWLGKFISRSADGQPSRAVFWISNIAAALIFGAAHLPATAVVIPLTPLVVARAILLNGLAGIGFGWLYWKRGLESAMLSHFSADIVLHVLLAL